jgi:hypothetical protein
MRNGILLAIAGAVFVAGCGNQTAKAPTPATTTQLKTPYHIEFDTKPAKPNPAGVALPAIHYLANPQAMQRRAALVVRIDSPAAKSDKPGSRLLVGPAVDLPGTGGTLPESYMNLADQQLAKALATACMNGPIKISVALVRSSIKPGPSDAEVDAKRLSDWVPDEVVFKNPHPKC